MIMNCKKLFGFLICGLLLAACSHEKVTEDSEGISIYTSDSVAANQAQLNTVNSKIQKVAAEADELIDFASVSMVNFAFNSDKLQSSDIAKLDSQVKYLQENPHVSIVIEGHTDFLGTKEYNLALGERRANSVKRHLVSKGIEASRIQVVSFGKSKPIDPALTDDARAQNRRAVSILK